ncbi:MAG: hypothetical protein QXT45_04290 [Candidatus Bilamarchaeaceae archaeon]
MTQSNNIKDREFSKFVDSPVRINESAVETVSYVLELPQNGSIVNATVGPNAVVPVNIPAANKVILKSNKAVRFQVSFDNVNWVTIPIGGVLLLRGGNVTLSLLNLTSKSFTLELILYN